MRDFNKNPDSYYVLGTGYGGPKLHGASGLGFSAWIVIDTVDTLNQNNNPIVGIEVGSGNTGLTVTIDALSVPGERHLFAYTRSTTADALQSSRATTSMALGTLHHIAGAVDFSSDDVHLYVNNTKDTDTTPVYGASTFTYGSATESDRIGASNLSVVNARQFDGAIGHLALFNRMITDDEVAALSFGMNPWLIDGLAMYFPLDGDDTVDYDHVTGTAVSAIGGVAKRTEEAPVIPLEYLRAHPAAFTATGTQLITPHSFNLIRQMAA
jgi:hypothetical protein